MAQDIEMERRLAAVLAADVAGYSRLTDQDEIGTLRSLAAQRAILDSAIARHRGRIANTAGDSVLAEFPSAVNAVQCAVEAQQALCDAAENIPEDRRVLFRIGIHVGDVMVRHGDLLGTGVNVAARLETLADAGGIVLSAAAHEQVRKILPLAYTDLGPQRVRNIEEPVRAFAIGETDASRRSVPPEPGKALPLPDKPSIAVLPFQNMSGDSEHEYFADGMVDDIITALSRFKSLFVIARHSSFTYKNKPIDVKDVGRELGVRYVLEGSVRKGGERVRITIQLIEATTGLHLWADKFDGAMEDVFNLQDSIAEHVVAFLMPNVRAAEISRATRKRANHLSAYDSLLRAQSLLAIDTTDRIPDAIRHLERAVEVDPNFALPYAMIAYSYARLYVAGANADLEEERRKALDYARKSIALASDDSETLFYAAFAIGNFEGSMTALAERCVTLNPNLAVGWFLLGSDRLYRGSYEQALECQARALRLSPIGPTRVSAMTSTALAYLLSDRFDLAYSWAERAYQESSNHPFVVRVFAMCAALAGNRERAHMAFQIFASTAPKYLERVKTFMIDNKEGYEKIASAMRLASTPG